MARGQQETLGQYRLLNIVMTGQTSQVWEVLHTGTHERRALKMLLSNFRKDREHIGYLKHECAVGQGLDHPRVIRIHEFGIERGIPFVIMELYPHPNLKQWIRRGVDKIAYYVPRIISEAAEGLAYFNDQGWIHRDVKPENYLVGPGGEVRLIDFALAEKKKSGLAKLFGGKSKIQGTKSYMSPEQIRGKALDLRSDVYSFGCSIFELLAGRPPFTGGSSQELLTKHLRQPAPSLLASNTNVTKEFSALVQRLMAKDPDNRPDSMNKFLQEFQAIRVFKQAPPRPTEAEENAG